MRLATRLRATNLLALREGASTSTSTTAVTSVISSVASNEFIICPLCVPADRGAHYGHRCLASDQSFLDIPYALRRTYLPENSSHPDIRLGCGERANPPGGSPLWCLQSPTPNSKAPMLIRVDRPGVMLHLGLVDGNLTSQGCRCG